MTIFISIIFAFIPIMGLMLSIIGYIINDNRKSNIIYSFLIALFLGLIAYNFNPPKDYDLFRHHLVVENLIGKNFNYFFKYSKIVDLEQFPLLICYLVGKTKQINLLQFIIVTIGYFIIFYLLGDYKIDKKIKPLLFILLSSFTFFSFNALNFLSGLWYYLAVIIFSLAFYFDYIKEKNKIFCYVLYLLAFLLHNSMLFPLAILIIYKIFKNKLNIKILIITILIFLLPTFILEFVNSILNISVLKTIERTFNSYFFNNSQMYKFYGGKVFIIEIMKSLIILISICMQSNRKKITGINGFIILLFISMIVMLLKSIVMLRFVMLIGFLGIIPLFDTFNNLTKNKVFLIILIFILLIIYFSYFIKLFRYQDFGNLFSEKIVHSIIYYFN